MTHAKTPSRHVVRLTAAILVAVVLAAGCGSEDSGTAAAEGTPLSQVYEQIEGLDREARHEKLLELAAEEDSDLELYTIVNLDDTAVYSSAFTESTGVEVNAFKAKGTPLLQRVLEEYSADRVAFDVLMISSPEMIIIDGEGIMHPLRTPYTEEIVQSTVNANWSGVYLNVFLSAWNTDLLDAAERPTTWEQVLTGYPGGLALEAGDFDWFATLVQEHFIADLGYTEEQALDLFRTAASQGRIVDGHVTMAELLGAGEFDVVSSAYHHGIERFRNDGSPIAWQPAVEPLVMRSTGIGIYADTEIPATALLFVDFMLSSDGQRQLTSVFRTPANTTVAGGIPSEVDVLTIDVEALNESREKWEALYEEIIRGS